MSKTIADAIPEDAPVSISDITLKTGGLLPSPFNKEAAQILSGWHKRTRANPNLFNGIVYLQSALHLENGILSGNAVELDYASFMHWRGNFAFQEETGLYHVFPLAAIESKEGHLVAVRSASTTVNSGLTYFAAGMFDEQDVVNDRLDPLGNMCREVQEETGLDLNEMTTNGSLMAFRTGRFVALFQRYVSTEPSVKLAEKIHNFVKSQTAPEIDRVIVMAGVADVVTDMPGYMRAYCLWRFASQTTRA